MDLGVRDKRFVIVGGTSGMGFAAGQALAADGAALVLIGRDRDRAERAAAQLRDAHGAEVDIAVADIRDTGQVDDALAGAAARPGGVQGIAVLTGLLGHVPIDSPDDEWLTALDDVLMGTVRSVRAALPHLVAGGGGTIVTTSAYSIRDPQAARLPYGAAKAAVATFTKGVAKAYGKHDIRANCVCPGAIETEALHAMRQHVADSKGWPYDEALERVMVEEWGMHVALARPGQPAEVGDLIAFLLSARAGYLTGALINIDGGTDF